MTGDALNTRCMRRITLTRSDLTTVSYVCELSNFQLHIERLEVL